MGCEVVVGGWRMPSKPCDSCRTGVAALFCRADSAFLCLLCDDRIHGANKLASRHARVWLCEVCEHAPAAFTCKADAAVLCISCDADIHSANPLASRHERIPVVPFLDSAAAALKPNTCELDVFLSEADRRLPTGDDSVPPWLLPSPCMEMEVPKITASTEGDNNIDLLNVMDPYVDFDFGFPVHGSDSVVPVQVKTEEPLLFQMKPPVPMPAPEKCFDIEFCRSKLTSFCLPAHQSSIGKNFQTSSSHDFGVVPDGSTTTTATTTNMSDRSQSFVGSINSYVTAAGSNNSCIVDPPSTEAPPTAPVPATPLFGVDREARVLRYREKRKNRKFEKTIRYASRKAYAETRPRIKGRFAKRTDSHDHEPQLIDNMIFGRSATTLFFVDSDFGLVPTF